MMSQQFLSDAKDICMYKISVQRAHVEIVERAFMSTWSMHPHCKSKDITRNMQRWRSGHLDTSNHAVYPLGNSKTVVLRSPETSQHACPGCLGSFLHKVHLPAFSKLLLTETCRLQTALQPSTLLVHIMQVFGAKARDT